MIAMGCKCLRICHLNNCATGVATQDDRLREEHFRGTVEMVDFFFEFVAGKREWMARAGVRTLEELIGRTDLLMSRGLSKKHQHLDLSPILSNDLVPADKPQFCTQPKNEPTIKAKRPSRWWPICCLPLSVRCRGVVLGD